MNWKSFFTLLVFFAVFLNFIPLHAQSSPNNIERDSLIQKTIESLQKEKYDSAFGFADLLINKFPNDASGYFLKADAYQTIMRDYRVRTYEVEFDSMITLAVEISKKATEQNPIAEKYFIYGVSEGYRCLHLFRTGKWVKAIGAAIRTSKMLRKALELNPEFVDPLLGLALYDYGKSKVELLGLSLFSDKTDRIIRDLKKVHKESRFLSINALFTLQLIYFEAGQFDKAREVNEKLLSLFPEHPVGQYYRALTLEERDSLQAAKQYWLNLLDKIENFNPSSNNYLAECNYHLAKIAYESEQLPQARAYIREAARYIRQYRKEEELNGTLYTFDDIKDRINNALQKWDLNQQ